MCLRPSTPSSLARFIHWLTTQPARRAPRSAREIFDLVRIRGEKDALWRSFGIGQRLCDPLTLGPRRFVCYRPLGFAQRHLLWLSPRKCFDVAARPFDFISPPQLRTAELWDGEIAVVRNLRTKVERVRSAKSGRSSVRLPCHRPTTVLS